MENENLKSLFFSPPGQAAVLFKTEPRLTSVRNAEENWRRRKCKQTAAASIQLESVYSAELSEQCENVETFSKIPSSVDENQTKTDTSRQRTLTFDSSLPCNAST